MLRVCSEKEFDPFLDFAYGLAMDLTKSGYPTYCDGIKTKAMFVEQSHRAFKRQTEQMLFFEYEGTVEGIIHYEWIPEDRYLSTVSFNINTGVQQALAEFLAFAGEHFKGYDLFLGFSAENKQAVDYLAGHGFECIEDDYNNTAFLDRCKEMQDNSEPIRIHKGNYESFRLLHSRIEGDMYWNSDRILADLENWNVLLKEKDGKPQGAVYYRNIGDGWSEIFGLDTENGKYDKELFVELLGGALLDAREKGDRVMTFFCEKEAEEAALECGFSYIGNYLCFKKHLE